MTGRAKLDSFMDMTFVLTGAILYSCHTLAASDQIRQPVKVEQGVADDGKPLPHVDVVFASGERYRVSVERVEQ